MTAKTHPTAGAPPLVRPYLTLGEAGHLACCSRGKLYLLAAEKKIEFVKLGGRTLATVASLARYLDGAAAYVPDGSDKRGLARTRAAAVRPEPPAR